MNKRKFIECPLSQLYLPHMSARNKKEAKTPFVGSGFHARPCNESIETQNITIKMMLNVKIISVCVRIIPVCVLIG